MVSHCHNKYLKLADPPIIHQEVMTDDKTWMSMKLTCGNCNDRIYLQEVIIGGISPERRQKQGP